MFLKLTHEPACEYPTHPWSNRQDVKWPCRHFLRLSDERDEEGVSHVTESLHKGQVSTEETVSLSALFLLAQMFHSAETGAKCS